MKQPVSFGSRSTADHVLAGIDLTGKRMVVTGCNSGIGLQTMHALAANGAQVIGLAKSLEHATSACLEAGPACTPVACDLSDLESVAAAVDSIAELHVPLDSVVANAAIANLPDLQTRDGVELQFLINHVGHFALVNGLTPLVRDGTGRVVIVSSSAAKTHAPREGIMFDNLDGQRCYDALMFYGQSKLANALYAKELSRRLLGRGIAVNSVHPGATRGTGLHRGLRLPLRAALSVARLFMKSAPQGAATPALLAASPSVAGISGEYWSNCHIDQTNPLVNDAGLAKRLWDVTQEIVARLLPADEGRLPHAA